MTNGSFHDPYTGANFSARILTGSYGVPNSAGVILPYHTISGAAKSSCTCPICSKVFDVDLIPGAVDSSGGYDLVKISLGLI